MVSTQRLAELFELPLGPVQRLPLAQFMDATPTSFSICRRSRWPGSGNKVNDGAYLAIETNFPEGTISNLGDAGHQGHDGPDPDRGAVHRPVAVGRGAADHQPERDPDHEGAPRQVRREDDVGEGHQLHLVEQHRRVRIEPDGRPVGAVNVLCGADDDRLVNVALLHAAARRRFLDGDDDDVADAGEAPLRAAKHLDALDALRAAIVGDIKVGLHLDHRSIPSSKLQPEQVR